MGYPKGTGKHVRLGSFLLLREEEQMEEAQRTYDRLPQDNRDRLTVEDVRAIFAAVAEQKDVSEEPSSEKPE
jgi:hypothetical protein